MGNIHILVMFVIERSVTQIIWRYIDVHIVESVRIVVLCATRCSARNVFWRNIFSSVVISTHNLIICICHLLWFIMWWIITITDCGVLFLVVFEKNFPTCSDIILHLGISHVDGFGGLGVACWRTQVCGLKPGRSRRIFRAKKFLSAPSFGGKVNPLVPCRRFAACKRSLNLCGSLNLGKITTGHLYRPQFHLSLLGSLRSLRTEAPGG